MFQNGRLVKNINEVKRYLVTFVNRGDGIRPFKMLRTPKKRTCNRKGENCDLI
jgi:hypothetical protein